MTKKKVSCLTFHNSRNYGAALQTYALYTFVTGLGYAYEVIDYANVQKRKHDTLLGKNQEMGGCLYMLKLLQFPVNLIVDRKFKRFSNRHVLKTCRMRTYKQLQEYAKGRDAIIIGSDQVWNCATIRYDRAYFLKFVAADKRVAYAPSFGITECTQEQRAFYKQMLTGMRYLSVREKSSVELLHNLGCEGAKEVLDPTLLLTKDDWEKVAISPRKKRYIFAYILRNDLQAKKFLKALKRKTGLPVYSVYRGYVPAIRDGACTIVGPEQWVGYLMHAEYVVTTSFHGTAFSINFCKAFFLFTGDDRLYGNNVRQNDLIAKFHLENRKNPKDVEEAVKIKTDWGRVHAILDAERGNSKKWLLSALEEVCG